MIKLIRSKDSVMLLRNNHEIILQTNIKKIISSIEWAIDIELDTRRYLKIYIRMLMGEYDLSLDDVSKVSKMHKSSISELVNFKKNTMAEKNLLRIFKAVNYLKNRRIEGKPLHKEQWADGGVKMKSVPYYLADI